MKNVIWSNKSESELEHILDYWDKRTKSTVYSNKILTHTDDALQKLMLSPNLGIETNFLNVRMRLILKHFYIVYKIEENNLLV